jgi:lysozyme
MLGHALRVTDEVDIEYHGTMNITYSIPSGRAVLLTLPVVVALGFGLACDRSPGTSAPTPAPATAPRATAPPAPPIQARLQRGIDVSSHSGEVDWVQVRDQQFSFAVVKASEGMDLPDPEHDAHWQRLTATGMLRGAYHFYVTEDDPDAQADLFLATAKLEPGDLAPVVDVEVIGHATPPGLDARLQRFLDRLEEAYGAPPIIYTTARFWDAHLPATFGRYPLWVAEFEVDEPNLPHGWDRWHLWQYEDDSDVPGVAKDADLTRGNTEIEDLGTLLIPAN